MHADDPALWDALVAAERLVAQRRATVHQSDARVELLTAALAADASVWDQRAAMLYLKSFPREVPRFVPALFQYVLGERSQALAREVLAGAVRADVLAEVRRLVTGHLPRADAGDYLHIAALLASLDADEALAELVASARSSDDPEVRAAGEFVADQQQM